MADLAGSLDSQVELAVAASLEFSAKKYVKIFATDQVVLLLAEMVSANLQNWSMVLALSWQTYERTILSISSLIFLFLMITHCFYGEKLQMTRAALDREREEACYD